MRNIRNLPEHCSHPIFQRHFGEIQTYCRVIQNKYSIQNKADFMQHISKKQIIQEVQDTRHCTYSIPYECGSCYIGETGRPHGVQTREHMNNLKEKLREKSRLAKHACKEGHCIQQKKAKAV
jgi:hypothetical protein